MFNKITIVGKLGTVPKIKQYSGVEKAWFSVSTSRKTKDGFTTDWHSVECWGRLVDEIRHIKKGEFVKVTGALIYNTWVDTLGDRQSRPVIRAKELGPWTEEDIFSTPSKSQRARRKPREPRGERNPMMQEPTKEDLPPWEDPPGESSLNIPEGKPGNSEIPF